MFRGPGSRLHNTLSYATKRTHVLSSSRATCGAGEWRGADTLLRLEASTSGRGPAGGPSTLPLLWGKRVLLVEPCRMVREALMLALRSWGCRVCTVVAEPQAVQ